MNPVSTVSAVVLTAAMVTSVTGGRLISGAGERVFDGVSTDTRAITSGSLFVALRGDRFDGNAFAAQALELGAAGVLVSERFEPADGSSAVVIEVPDTLLALQAIGRAVRRQSGARVIAITGSAGKTTTKEVTAELLSVRYPDQVLRTRGNLNNHIGVPLSLIELRRGYEMAVIELGMNHEGEIRTLVGIAEPDVRVWINVGDAHIGYFGSRAAVARAKAEVLEGADMNTLVVANADDPFVVEHVAQSAARRVTFGESPDATVRAMNISDRGFEGTSADVVTPAGRLHLTVPLSGRAQLSNVLAAVAVALELGVPIPAIESTVAALVPVARRGAMTSLPNGARLIDDSYNASPAAVQAMLAALAATPAAGRRIAVLGEMRELGDSSRALHDACGRAAAHAKLDALIVIGGTDADAMAEGAEAAGLSSRSIHRFADSTAAAAQIGSFVASGDLILVKGSRGTRTDIVADRMREAV